MYIGYFFGAFIPLINGALANTDMTTADAHDDTFGTGTATGLSGISLVLQLRGIADNSHEFIIIDDVLVTATSAGTGGDNTFDNNQNIVFTGGDADISFITGATNVFDNSATITGLDDIDFYAAATSNSYVGATGSSLTGTGRILFKNLNGNTNNFITNDGIINMGDKLKIRQGNVTIINTANGDIDFIITPEQIKKINFKGEALVIRTMPNDRIKTTKNYSESNPAYLDVDCVKVLLENGVDHLLIDLPSVDRENDGGALAFHHAFWEVPQAPNFKRTITELIYVDNGIKDGKSILSFQVAPFNNDAAPSRPVLYSIK